MVLNQMMPIWTSLLAFVFTSERMKWFEWSNMIICFSAVVLIALNKQDES
jgi:drug/metabolite transporter (DMT)-like permease